MAQIFTSVGRYKDSGNAVFSRNIVHAQLLSTVELDPAGGMLSDPIEQPIFETPKGSGRAPATTVVDDAAEVP